jgi:hypothetical protein
MTKDQLWKEIINQNPAWSKDGARFTIQGIRKFFNLVYDRAYLRGQVDVSTATNMFEAMFGKGFKR